MEAPHSILGRPGRPACVPCWLVLSAVGRSCNSELSGNSRISRLAEEVMQPVTHGVRKASFCGGWVLGA